MNSTLYFEDFKVGTVSEYGPRLVTREEIVAFATEFDPQPMHLDETAGSATMLGSLAASGWHTCCLMMRMMVDGFVGASSSLGAPGVDEVRWLLPLRPGTQIRVRTTVLDTRASNSRPGVGFVKLLCEVIDERDATLMTLGTSLMFGLRGAQAQAQVAAR
jgi:acyl dehydratase